VLVSSPLEVALTSRGQTRAAAAAYLLSDGLRAGAMVVPALLGWGLEGVMWALAAFGLLRIATCGGVLLGFGQGPLFRPRLLREQLAHAAPFGAAMALAIPQQYAHQFAVSGLVAPELFALYAVGCFQLPLVGLLYTPVSEVLMVRMGELEREGRPREGAHCFREATGRLAQVFLPLGAFLFAAAPELISALFGARFLPAVPLFRIGVLGTVLAIFPVDGALRATNRTRHLFRSYLLKAVVTVPAVYLGVTLLGMKGAIASSVLTEVVGVAVLMAALPGAVGERGWRAAVDRLIPWRELGWATVGALGAGLGVVLLRALVGESWEMLPEGLPWRFVPLAAAALAFSLAYLGVLWAVRQPLPLTRR
jgi:O-antigen/teichoic acid export membrane protein